MVIDYKDVSFSFDKVKRKKRLKRIRMAVLAVVVVLLFLFIANLRDSGKLGDVQELLLAGKTGEAARRFDEIRSSMFHGETRRELDALVHLARGDYDGAEKILATVTKGSDLVESEKFLDDYVDRAAYRELDIYCAHLIKRDRAGAETPKGHRRLFLRALARAGLFDHSESETALELLPADFRTENQKALAPVIRLNDQLKKGVVPFIFDVNGNPLAEYDVGAQKSRSLVPGIDFSDFDGHMAAGVRFYHLTLDARLQNIVHRLFRNFHGSFVLLKVDDSSIVAAYSKPENPLSDGPKRVNGNAVFSEMYEPGSIIKILTMVAHLNYSDKELFPLQCRGRLRMGDRVFRDWITHDHVETINDALVTSCNISFARMGLGVGPDKMSDMLNRFFFNASPGTFKDRFLTFGTGTYNGNVSSPFGLANLSVGLEEISITTFHAGMLSAVVAQNGSVYSPYLIKNTKNVLDLAFYRHESRLLEVFKGNRIYVKVKEAMGHVVDSPKGTGRRARVDFVDSALKTGTAGDPRQGLDAVLTGFFPTNAPQYAFAFRLERAGKAELKGALLLKGFLNALYQKM